MLFVILEGFKERRNVICGRGHMGHAKFSFSSSLQNKEWALALENLAWQQPHL